MNPSQNRVDGLPKTTLSDRSARQQATEIQEDLFACSPNNRRYSSTFGLANRQYVATDTTFQGPSAPGGLTNDRQSFLAGGTKPQTLSSLVPDHLRPEIALSGSSTDPRLQRHWIDSSRYPETTPPKTGYGRPTPASHANHAYQRVPHPDPGVSQSQIYSFRHLNAMTEQEGLVPWSHFAAVTKKLGDIETSCRAEFRRLQERIGRLEKEEAIEKLCTQNKQRDDYDKLQEKCKEQEETIEALRAQLSQKGVQKEVVVYDLTSEVDEIKEELTEDGKLDDTAGDISVQQPSSNVVRTHSATPARSGTEKRVRNWAVETRSPYFASREPGLRGEMNATVQNTNSTTVEDAAAQDRSPLQIDEYNNITDTRTRVPHGGVEEDEASTIIVRPTMSVQSNMRSISKGQPELSDQSQNKNTRSTRPAITVAATTAAPSASSSQSPGTTSPISVLGKRKLRSETEVTGTRDIFLFEQVLDKLRNFTGPQYILFTYLFSQQPVKPFSSTVALLQPLILAELAKWRSKDLIPYSEQGKIADKKTCLKRKRLRRPTNLGKGAEGGNFACMDCERTGILCFRVTDEGMLGVVPLRDEVRGDKRDHLDFWIKNEEMH